MLALVSLLFTIAATLASCTSAVAAGAQSPTAQRWLSRQYAEKGLLDKALDAAAAALLLDPDPADQRFIDRLVDRGLPASMDRRTPEALALPLAFFAITAGDDRLTGAPGPWQGLVILTDRDSVATDSRFGARFDRACYGYILEPGSQRWRLVLSVHYDAAAGAQRRELAANSAGLLLRVECLREAYLGPDLDSPAGSRQPVNLWLSDTGHPGAESWGADIYIFAAATQRPAAEWVRQLIHEYGHIALPGVDHFVSPEPWANGRLGEHLFARWLAQSHEAPGDGSGAPRLQSVALPAPAYPWMAASYLQPLVADADRCLMAFVARGPGRELTDDCSDAGMDYYLGLANYVERAFGPRLLARAMGQTRGNACRDFELGVQEALRQESAPGIEMRTLPEVALAGLRQWIYLPGGGWRATCSGAAVMFNGRVVTARDTDVGRVAGGWHAIRLPHGATIRFTAAPS